MRGALFRLNPFGFLLHSGRRVAWKVECDVLVQGDWDWAAADIVHRVGTFSAVEGVPKGGLLLAKALRPYVGQSGPLLIVDDVLTSGDSMETQRNGRFALGCVVFDRSCGQRPAWVDALWVYNQGRRRYVD